VMIYRGMQLLRYRRPHPGRSRRSRRRRCSRNGEV